MTFEQLIEQLFEQGVTHVMAHKEALKPEHDALYFYSNNQTIPSTRIKGLTPELQQRVADALNAIYLVDTPEDELVNVAPYRSSLLTTQTGEIKMSQSTLPPHTKGWRGEEDLLSDMANLYEIAQDIDHIQVEYQGEGDSGDVVEASFYNLDDEVVPMGSEWVALAEDLGEKLVSRLFSGWENDDGGQGSIKICPLYGTIDIEHNAFYQGREAVGDIDVELDRLDIEKALKTGFTQLKDRLRDDGISLHSSYQGGGNSGDVMDIRVERQGSEVDVREVLSEPEQALMEELTYEVLENCYQGWENNEGAEGEIAFHLDSSIVNVDHSRFVQMTNTSTLSNILLFAAIVYEPKRDGSFEEFSDGGDLYGTDDRLVSPYNG